METICWKDEYSIGIEKLDRQHQHLFEITNKLIEASDNSELISDILSEMTDYAKEHFTDEEELMQKYGYSEIESQKKQHIYFINTTTELITSAMDDKKTTADETAELLTLWLINHILKSDMKYRDFFKAKMLTEV